MDLLLHFDKNTLIDIKNELLHLNPTISKTAALGSIELKDFCYVFLRRIQHGYKGYDASEKTVRMLCHIFDSIDVDSR